MCQFITEPGAGVEEGPRSSGFVPFGGLLTGDSDSVLGGGQDLFRPKAGKLCRRKKKGTGQGRSKQEKLQAYIFGAEMWVSRRTGQAGGKE